MVRILFHIGIFLLLIKGIFYHLPSIDYIYWDRLYFIFVIILLAIVYSGRIIRNNIPGTWNKTMIFPFLLLLYILLHTMLAGRFESEKETLLIITVSLIFYILLKQLYYEKMITIDSINTTIIFSAFVLGLIGFLNYNPATTKLITGSFRNPNLFSIILSLAYPSCISYILFSPVESTRQKLISLVAIFTSTMTWYIAVSNNSRTAIICILLSTIIALYIKFSKRSRAFLWSAIIFVITIISIAAFLLFQSKKASYTGRIFISTVAIKAIMDKPILGHGLNSFKLIYPGYQEKHFREHQNQKDIDVADNVTHAFNEYVQLSFEFGFPLLLITIYLFIILFLANGRQKDPMTRTFHLCFLVQIAVGSLFYNYLRDYDISVFVLLGIAMMSTPKDSSLHKSFRIGTLPIVGAIFLGIVTLSNTIQYTVAQHNWWKANKINKNFTDIKNLLQRAEPVLRNNGQYQFNTGALMYLNDDFIPAQKHLEKARSLLINSDILLYSGNNCFALGKKDSARYFYEKAKMILPGRFLPRNKLMNFYLSQKDTMQAKFEALEVSKMKIKIPSQMVNKIKLNANRILTY